MDYGDNYASKTDYGDNLPFYLLKNLIKISIFILIIISLIYLFVRIKFLLLLIDKIFAHLDRTKIFIKLDIR